MPKKQNWDFRISYNIPWNSNVLELSVAERLMSKFSDTFSHLLQPHNLHLASSLLFKIPTNLNDNNTDGNSRLVRTYAPLIPSNSELPDLSPIIIFSMSDFTKKSHMRPAGMASVVHPNSHIVAGNAYLASICQHWKDSLPMWANAARHPSEATVHQWNHSSPMVVIGQC